MMAKDLLSAGDLSDGYGDEEDDKKKDDAEPDEDDPDLAELGAKYMERLATAMDEKDWPGAYHAFCRLAELHKYEESQEGCY